VWRWDQAEPFGDSPADENPSGLGAFDLPLRLPGQYYDAESALHYNYFRDYDPGVARYVQSDPIGLYGGSNTYAYALASPLLYVESDGLLYCISSNSIKVIAVMAGGAVTGGIQGGAIGAAVGLAVGGGLQYMANQYAGSNTPTGQIAMGAVSGLVAPGSARSRYVGAIAGAFTGAVVSQTPGTPAQGQNTAAGTLGGFVGNFVGQFVVPGAPYASRANIFLGTLKGGFAGAVGGFTQDFFETVLTKFNDCPERKICAPQ